MNASIPPNTAPTEAEEPCPIPRWYQDSPQREIEIIRTALARHRALLHQAHKAEEAARQVLVEACRQIGLRTDRDALSQWLADRLIDAEIAVAEGADNDERPIPSWHPDGPQREIEIIRTALARRRALLHQADQAEKAARQVLVEACRTLGPGTDREASAQCLEERLIEAEIAVAEGGAQ